MFTSTIAVADLAAVALDLGRVVDRFRDVLVHERRLPLPRRFERLLMVLRPRNRHLRAISPASRPACSHARRYAAIAPGADCGSASVQTPSACRGTPGRGSAASRVAICCAWSKLLRREALLRQSGEVHDVFGWRRGAHNMPPADSMMLIRSSYKQGRDSDARSDRAIDIPVGSCEVPRRLPRRPGRRLVLGVNPPTGSAAPPRCERSFEQVRQLPAID